MSANRIAQSLTWLGGGEWRELGERHERSTHVIVGVVVLLGAAHRTGDPIQRIVPGGGLQRRVAPVAHALLVSLTLHALEQIADQPDRLFGRGSGMDKMWREIFEQAHPSLVGPQQNHGLLGLQCQCNF